MAVGNQGKWGEGDVPSQLYSANLNWSHDQFKYFDTSLLYVG